MSLTNSQRLLEDGENRDQEDSVVALAAENLELRREIGRLSQELERERGRNARAVVKLRELLAPFHGWINALFGEMEGITPEELSAEAASFSQLSPAKNAVWQSWIAKLPGKRAEIIRALLEHGEMTVAQLRVATHSGQATIYSSVYELNKIGLIVKTAKGSYSLKQL